jgi:hypothetical protein
MGDGPIRLVEKSKYQHHVAEPWQIRVWWTRWPEAQPAVVTGAISGIMVALDT